MWGHDQRDSCPLTFKNTFIFQSSYTFTMLSLTLAHMSLTIALYNYYCYQPGSCEAPPVFLFPHLRSLLQTYCYTSLCCLHIRVLKSKSFNSLFVSQIEPPLPGFYSSLETRVSSYFKKLSLLQFLEHGRLTHHSTLALIASLINDTFSQTTQILPILQFPTPPWSLPRSL